MRSFNFPTFQCRVCIALLAVILFGCNTSRRMEEQKSDLAYKALGLKKERKDNNALYVTAASWLHAPYMEGGSSPNGTDCSFLVQSIYKTVYGKALERNTMAIYQKNCKKISKHQLREGDLVFFNTSKRSTPRVNHIGIYLKNNKFLHASTSKGVIVSDLEEPYFRKTWVDGGRVK